MLNYQLNYKIRSKKKQNKMTQLQSTNNNNLQDQIARILNKQQNNVSELQNQFQSRIDSIQQCLTQRSNFVKMFQEMLHNQLGVSSAMSQRNTTNQNQDTQNDIKQCKTSRDQHHSQTSQRQPIQSSIKLTIQQQHLVDQTFLSKTSCAKNPFKQQTFQQVQSYIPDKLIVLRKDKLKKACLNRQQSLQKNCIKYKIMNISKKVQLIKQQIQKLTIFTKQSFKFLQQFLINGVIKAGLHSIIQKVNESYQNKIENIIQQNFNKDKLILQLRLKLNKFINQQQKTMSKQNTIMSKQNTIMSRENTIMSKENTIMIKQNKIVNSQNTNKESTKSFIQQSKCYQNSQLLINSISKIKIHSINQSLTKHVSINQSVIRPLNNFSEQKQNIISFRPLPSNYQRKDFSLQDISRISINSKPIQNEQKYKQVKLFWTNNNYQCKKRQENNLNQQKTFNYAKQNKPITELSSINHFTQFNLQQNNQIQIKWNIPYLPPIQISKNQLNLLKINAKQDFKCYEKGQIKYQGGWNDCKFNGYGKLQTHSYFYQGHFKNGKFQGKGKLNINFTQKHNNNTQNQNYNHSKHINTKQNIRQKYNDDMVVYIGSFVNGMAEGNGILKISKYRDHKTLKQQFRQIVGQWKRNQLLRRY